MAKTIATILGVIFIIVGIVGFFAPGLGGFHLSAAHNIVHLISGAISLYFGLAGTLAGARLFDIIFGIIYGLLGICGFLFGVPGAPAMPGMATDSHLLRVLPGTLELGTNDHVLHIIIGIIYIIAALITRTAYERAVSGVES